MLNDAQKRYARKLARRSTTSHLFKEAFEISKIVGVVVLAVSPIVIGTYHAIIEKNIKYLGYWCLLYPVVLAGWGSYAATSGIRKYTKDVYGRKLVQAERDIENQNGLEKAVITAKFKEKE